jgi:hypothetical protein
MKNTGYNIHVVVEKRPILLYSNNHFEDMLHVSVVTRYIHSTADIDNGVRKSMCINFIIIVGLYMTLRWQWRKFLFAYNLKVWFYF